MYESPAQYPTTTHDAEDPSRKAALLISGSPSKPLHVQTVDIYHANVEIKLMANERQYSHPAALELVSNQLPPSIGTGCRAEITKKSLLGLEKASQIIDCAPYHLPLGSPGNGSNAKTYYEFFRTRSAQQLSRLQSQQEQQMAKDEFGKTHLKKSSCLDGGSVPAGRYFDALKGPELDVLKDSEKVLLPLGEKWPFLLRFPVVSFGIALGVATQAVLWKALATSGSMGFLRVPFEVNFALWCLALLVLVLILSIYALKCLFYFEAVRREFHHPVRVNFFFAPWIACMYIAVGIPPRIATSVHPSFWCVFVSPLLMLELKIYGQWLSGGKRKLSRVANASAHLSLVANFVSAMVSAQSGWIEPAIFFWAVGIAHYLVLFVTLYQRLPCAEALPRELHPVFFLFIAAPSTASVSWRYIAGEFDKISKVAYYVAVFLFGTLVIRVKLFCGFRFSIAWWAYTFPMTALANATVHYSVQVQHHLTQTFAVIFSAVATLTVLGVLICTILHVMWGSLFPNDIAIAITKNRNRERSMGHKARACVHGTSSQKPDTSVI